MKTVNHLCPNCGYHKLDVFYEIRNVPVHSVLIMKTREEALNYPKGDIVLGFCTSCGFITNIAFDPAMHEYSERYEETQGYSSTFNAFHQRLAARLIDKYDLHEKKIIEIGCGKGEFISLLCELGDNQGIGFDPAFVPGRNQGKKKNGVTFIKDFHSEKYSDFKADFICCKMTLEHIHETADFVRIIRQSLRGQQNTILFFQVPDVTRILNDLAFWDIYYEHCSYFSPGSLSRLFLSFGFEIIDLVSDYNNQYIMIELRTGLENKKNPAADPLNEDMESLQQQVIHFSRNLPSKQSAWRRIIQELYRSGKRVVIWGAGSKGVAFLTTLKIQDEIGYAVDINPYKQGTFMAGTGHEVVPPAYLKSYLPDVVIVMNPIYVEEIQHELDRLEVQADLIPV